MPEEIWKQVNSWEGYYWVSNLGRVKNRHNKILSLQLRANGYYQITLHYGKENMIVKHTLFTDWLRKHSFLIQIIYHR